MGYTGGKSGSGVYQTIINLMPPHRVYIEPFLGGGAILKLKRPAELNIGIDKDPEVIRWWKALAAANCGNGGMHRRAAPELPGAATTAGTTAGTGLDRSLNIIHGDGIRYLQDYRWQGDELVYCDPPYLLNTRATKKKHYACEMLGEAEHLELLRLIKRLPCRVLISGYSSVLYARELKSWNAYSFGASTRGGMAAEWIWCNYNRPFELHDYRYLGDNFRERENLRKVQKRWKARLERMPLLQRQALLAAIGETGGFSGAVVR